MAGPALRKWRGERRLQVVAALADVGSSTWLGWESGRTRPTFANALRIELVSEGAVRFETWGYSHNALQDAQDVIRQRENEYCASVGYSPFDDNATPPPDHEVA